MPKTLHTPGGQAMTVPPLPRDWASMPLLGKEEGSAPTEPARRITTEIMIRVCVKVFMLLLIYGERVGVKNSVPGTQYPVPSKIGCVQREFAPLAIEIYRNRFIFMLDVGTQMSSK